MASRNKVYDAQRYGRLGKDYLVLRLVNTRALKVKVGPGPSPWDHIGRGQVELHTTESSLPWMDQGYVVNDQPHSDWLTHEIMANTLGFAVANTETGEIVEKFKSLADAEAALEAILNGTYGAKTTLADAETVAALD